MSIIYFLVFMAGVVFSYLHKRREQKYMRDLDERIYRHERKFGWRKRRLV